MMRICQSCKTENQEDAIFCEGCGIKLPEENEGPVCAACGAVNEKGARFCENCGSKLSKDEMTQTAKGPECPACGTVNEAGALFCEACGTRLIEKENANATATPPTAPRPSKKMSKLQKILTAEVVGLIVLVALFFFIGNAKYSDESVAEAYFEAYASQDWQTVYSLIDVSNGELLQESRFEELMENAKLPEVTDYTVRKAAPPESDVTGTIQDFEVLYETEDGDVEQMYFSVINENEKKWFFFDEWHVAASAMTDPFQISIPQGAQITVDGIELDDDDRTDEGYEGMDNYGIVLFSGEHTVNVAMPWFEIYEQKIDTNDESSLLVSEMSPTEEGETALSAKMQIALEQLYNAAMTGADFETVETLFRAKDAKDCKKAYDALIDHLEDSDYTLNQVTFDDFDFDLRCEMGVIIGEMSCDAAYNYTYTGSDTPRIDDGDTTIHMVVSFAYEDDTYKLSGIDLPTVL